MPWIRGGDLPDLLFLRIRVKYSIMKRAILIALILAMITGTVTSDAWAGAQVYLTVTIGGGLVIGVVGVFIHVVFVQRIAEQQKQEEQRMAAADPLPLNVQSERLSSVGTYRDVLLPEGFFLSETDQARPQSLDRNLYLERFNQINKAWREAHPDLEVNFFTLRW